jgi:carbon storage regulator
MLVLSRRIGEVLLIAGNIRVTVLAVKGSQVRLGITGPSSVPVAQLEPVAERSEDAGTRASGGTEIPSAARHCSGGHER